MPNMPTAGGGYLKTRKAQKIKKYISHAVLHERVSINHILAPPCPVPTRYTLRARQNTTRTGVYTQYKAQHGHLEAFADTAASEQQNDNGTTQLLPATTQCRDDHVRPTAKHITKTYTPMYGHQRKHDTNILPQHECPPATPHPPASQKSVLQRLH